MKYTARYEIDSKFSLIASNGMSSRVELISRLGCQEVRGNATSARFTQLRVLGSARGRCNGKARSVVITSHGSS